VTEPDQPPSPPAPLEKTPADDETEQEEAQEGAQEVVASEKDEPETGVQTRRGPSSPVVMLTCTGMLIQCSHPTGKRKAEAEADPKREKKKSREISEPFEESEPEPGEVSLCYQRNLSAFCPLSLTPSPLYPLFFSAPTKKRRGVTSEPGSRKFQYVVGILHSQICQLRNGSIFHGPVKASDAPDYYEIVRRPIDLKAIKTRTRDGQIANSLEYQRDVYLMFANSMMYNRPDSDLYKMAEEVCPPNLPSDYPHSHLPSRR